MNKQKPYKEILDDALERVKFTTENLHLQWTDDDSTVTDLDIMDGNFPQDIDEFMTLMRRVEDVISAARKIKTQMQVELGDKFNGKVKKYRDSYIVGRPSTTYKPYDKEKVLDYLGEDWRAVVRPEFRITGVKAVAESRGDDANVIVESLFQKVITNNNLTILPESKAPKWMKELEDGEEQDLWEKKQKS